MKNYYDLIVNFDEVMYYFYEWEDNDVLNYIKIIPLIRVSKKNFKNILLNKIELEKEELNKIIDQTCFANGEKSNCLIICDNNNGLVLEFDKNGKEIAISTLNIEDALDINEISFCMKIYDLKYSLLSKREFNCVGRKDNFVKSFIIKELDELYDNKNESKLMYFYMELFKRKATSFENAYQEMKKSILNGIVKEHYNIYDLMILSHKKSGLSS